MAVKIKYDVSGADHEANAQGGDPGKQAPKGVYIVDFLEARLGFSKDDDGKPDKSRPRIECIFNIVAEADGSEPEENYAWLWEYISFSDASEWKLDQFLQALGVPTTKKEKGELDLTKFAGKVTDLKGKEHDGKVTRLKVRVRGDKDRDGDYRARVGGMYRLVDEEAEALDEELAAAIDEDDDEPDVSWEDGDDEESEEGLTAEDVDEMPTDELKALVKEHGIKPKKGMKVAEVRELVKEELGLIEEAEEDEDDDEDELPF